MLERVGPGVAAQFDFDNDGDRDIYVGNGHISGKSAKDYCSQFWRHDIYAGSSQEDPKLAKLFLKLQSDFGDNGSWNGFEHNCLLSNTGQGFDQIAFLVGLGHEFDTRAVVADDIDANGLVDLLIVQRPRGRPAVLQVWKNYLSNAGNWIGVNLPDRKNQLTPGTRVKLYAADVQQVAVVVNGDSFNCQSASTVHFGLGKVEQVDRIEVTRPNSKTISIINPNIGAYHSVPTPFAED